MAELKFEPRQCGPKSASLTTAVCHFSVPKKMTDMAGQLGESKAGLLPRESRVV